MRSPCTTAREKPRAAAKTQGKQPKINKKYTNFKSNAMQWPREIFLCKNRTYWILLTNERNPREKQRDEYLRRFTVTVIPQQDGTEWESVLSFLRTGVFSECLSALISCWSSGSSPRAKRRQWWDDQVSCVLMVRHVSFVETSFPSYSLTFIHPVWPPAGCVRLEIAALTHSSPDYPS